eukprot:TRINITY_DN4751_c0_g1_i3.p1 TRINITY_DN4751_c0_g1~~TRINITY_DN4751_c0_g1_i3.p1  ORF type:complete len:270 (+),score=84.53 TRINITY_DN4751_c0_g1_i3:218-1027(+)
MIIPQFSSMLILRVLFLLIAISKRGSGKKVHEVHWNASNPMFRIDNTDNVIDVNVSNGLFEFDQANFVCPYYQGTSSSSSANKDEKETYIIYNVSKEEFDSCIILNPNSRVIAVCDDPNKLLYFTITFRSFTPTPGGLEFKPGEDYYFITTSSKGELNRKNGGRCNSHNMKVIFKIAPLDGRKVEENEVPLEDEPSRRLYSPSPKNRKTHKDRHHFRRKHHSPPPPGETMFKQEASRMPSSSAIIIPLFSPLLVSLNLFVFLVAAFSWR